MHCKILRDRLLKKECFVLIRPKANTAIFTNIAAGLGRMHCNIFNMNE